MEEPPFKKVRTESEATPLPPGWTEHTAPTGHKYYYNKSFKKSTYVRPVFEQPAAPQLPAVAAYTNPHGFPYAQKPASDYPVQSAIPTGAAQSNGHRVSTNLHRNAPRIQPKDRPKRKEVLLDFAPWILVYTRLGRRFVHNLETKESLWKFPPAVMTAVIAHDQLRYTTKLEGKGGPGNEETGTPTKTHTGGEVSGETKGTAEAGQAQSEEDKRALAEYEAKRAASLAREKNEDAKLLAGGEEERVWVPSAPTAPLYDSSEYEEVEVTDTEGEGSDDDDAEGAEADAGPLEFDEDDIAYQLAAMEQQYSPYDDVDNGDEAEGLDDGDFGENDYDSPDDHVEHLTDEQRYEMFTIALTEHGITAFTPWENVISDTNLHPVLDDERFTIIPSSRGRREAFDRWAREQAALRQASRRDASSKGEDDAKTAFVTFLEKNAKEVKKLYWVEFRRKNKKDAALKGNAKFGDREMEKVYREHAAKLKQGRG